MRYINHYIALLLLPMTLRSNFLLFSFVALLTACTSTPFTELNSRNNFQLEQGSNFKIQLNKDKVAKVVDKKINYSIPKSKPLIVKKIKKEDT